jgi:hypothetical protein
LTVFCARFSRILKFHKRCFALATGEQKSLSRIHRRINDLKIFQKKEEEGNSIRDQVQMTLSMKNDATATPFMHNILPVFDKKIVLTQK